MKRLSLQRLFFDRNRIPDHLPGDECQCDGCTGRLKVYATKYRNIDGERWRVRYLHCNACHHRPEENKNLIPPQFYTGKTTSDV